MESSDNYKGAEAAEAPSANGPVSFAASIKPLWTPKDLDCMAGYGVMLDDYGYMSDAAGGKVGQAPKFPDHAHARAVDWYLSNGKMPRGGEPTWKGTPKLALYQQWMTDGFKP